MLRSIVVRTAPSDDGTASLVFIWSTLRSWPQSGQNNSVIIYSPSVITFRPTMSRLRKTRFRGHPYSHTGNSVNHNDVDYSVIWDIVHIYSSYAHKMSNYLWISLGTLWLGHTSYALKYWPNLTCTGVDGLVFSTRVFLP